MIFRDGVATAYRGDISQNDSPLEAPIDQIRLDELPTSSTEVLVVGAGPTGLMAALVLARRGVPTILIDGKAGPTRESRALAVQARSMEIYHQLGLSDQVLTGGYLANRVQLGSGTEPLGFRIDEAQQADTDFPGLHIFEQSANEELLAGALERTDVDVRWGHRLVALPEDDDIGVTALVEGPSGLQRIRARWCIGADGAGSAVRRTIGASFDGITDDAHFFVADLRGVAGLPERCLAARFGEETFALFFPLGPDGHARIVSMALGDTVDADEALAKARDDLGISYTDVDWFSSYRVHHRVASTFRKGAVFLAGDAAHVHSPVGGQGMNTGLQDAHNLANLLADVASGLVDAAALERYEAERRPMARNLVTVTDRVFGVIAGRGRRVAWLRRRLARVVAAIAPRMITGSPGPWLGGLLGQYRIRYHFVAGGRGVTVPRWADDPTVGRRLPPVRDGGDAGPDRDSGQNLESLRSFSWQLYCYGGSIGRPDVPDQIEGPHLFGADPRGRLRPDRAYLIRPDGYVAASLPIAGGRVEPSGLADALAAHHIVR